jgi:hypothetical protein
LVANGVAASGSPDWHNDVLKQSNPNTLGYYVNAGDECLGVSSAELQEVVEGVFIRSRIKPVQDFNQPIYLNVIMDCMEANSGNFVAVDFSIRFARYNPKPAILYDWGYGAVGTASSKNFLLDQSKQMVEQAITDYIKANFNL